MNISPLLNLVFTVINLYVFALFVWIALDFLSRFNIINSHHPLVRRLMDFGYSLYNPLLEKIRKIIPPVAGIDLSPLILILLLELIKGFLIR